MSQKIRRFVNIEIDHLLGFILRQNIMEKKIFGIKLFMIAVKFELNTEPAQTIKFESEFPKLDFFND
ncbi:hypothetical protein BpHYR1_053231 [Brachionus plicatilis]|uniref:Uncharacterized protein n=1 Tax=Brachionus plicatilis TaxID=10195 RepID=A0A3M7SH82_BRAPC|nr:hypothetical protein BpHYR1_053231 [Brachionus plicatilis]